jgi:hypothetical protein
MNAAPGRAHKDATDAFMEWHPPAVLPQPFPARTWKEPSPSPSAHRPHPRPDDLMLARNAAQELDCGGYRSRGAAHSRVPVVIWGPKRLLRWLSEPDVARLR